MTITRRITVFDTADLQASSSFWAGVLGGTAEGDDEWHTVLVDGVSQLGFQLAPDHLRPDWPDGEPQQLHLDLYVDDIEAEEARVLGLNARLLQSAPAEAAEGFRVYADPAGHPFCLCWG